jgi:hypothetical protein
LLFNYVLIKTKVITLDNSTISASTACLSFFNKLLTIPMNLSMLIINTYKYDDILNTAIELVFNRDLAVDLARFKMLTGILTYKNNNVELAEEQFIP